MLRKKHPSTEVLFFQRKFISKENWGTVTK